VTRETAAREVAAAFPDVAADLRSGVAVASCRALLEWHACRRLTGAARTALRRGRLALALLAAAG
jgi:hypothetical protein